MLLLRGQRVFQFKSLPLCLPLSRFFVSRKRVDVVFSAQSYKAPTIVIYVSRVVNISNLLVSMTLEL